MFESILPGTEESPERLISGMVETNRRGFRVDHPEAAWGSLASSNSGCKKILAVVVTGGAIKYPAFPF